jgi:hypothetical protein
MADSTTKGWLERPEGKFGTVVTLLLLVGGGVALLMFWGAVLPWLIMMATNTLTLIALCGIIALIGVVVFDPRWRNLLWYAYKSIMRGLTGLFIEIDPIGILQTYVKSLTEKLEDMDKSIANLKGQIKKLTLQIQQNESSRINSLQRMQEAQKHGEEYRNVMILQSRQAGRLQKSNMTLQNLLDRMTTLLRVLEKMRGASAIMVEDIKGEVDVRTKERAALLAGYGAFSKARKIMQGGGDEKEMFDMTMDKLADDYGMKMGEIESFMDVSKGFIDTVDLDNGVFEQNALNQLEEWEKKSQNLLLSNPPPANVRVDVNAAPGVRVLPAAGGDGFSDLFTNETTEDATVKHVRR